MQTDSQGRRGYTVEEVREMAIAKGLPCEIRKIGEYKSGGKKVGMEIIKPRSTVEALGLEREWSLYYPHEYPQAKAKPLQAAFPRPVMVFPIERGQRIASTIEMNGKTFEVPIVTLPDNKRFQYWPGELIFTVYECRKGQWRSLGAMAKLEPAQRLMEKSGDAMALSIEYHPRLPYHFPLFRLRIALISKRDTKDLKVHYMGQSYPAEVNQCTA